VIPGRTVLPWPATSKPFEFPQPSRSRRPRTGGKRSLRREAVPNSIYRHFSRLCRWVTDHRTALLRPLLDSMSGAGCDIYN